MKSILLLLLGALLGAVPVSISIAAEESAARAVGDVPGEAEIRARLDAIVIPKVNFSGMPLSKVLAELEALAGKGSGIRFVQTAAETSDPKVNISLRNLSLARILAFVCQQVNHRWSVRDGVIVVEPITDGEVMETDRGVDQLFFLRLRPAHS